MQRIRDFFKEDRYRQKLASAGKTVELKKTYERKLKQNINTEDFWDERISCDNDIKHKGPMTQDRIKSAVNFLDANRGKLLDIGIGYGFFEILVSKKRPNISLHGIDISGKALKKIGNLVSGVYKKGSILKIPFKKNTFDMVVALEVLEHIDAGDTFKAYKEIKRVLKDGGQFIISVPVFEKYTQEFNPNRHMRAYTPNLFLTELNIAGFKIEKIKELYAFSKFYFLKNLLRKYFLKNRWKPNVILVCCKNP